MRSSDICAKCQEELSTMDVPEPVDLGDQICWYDNLEVKIHHCNSRRKVATEQHSQGKMPIMPQCALCTKKDKYMPLPATTVKGYASIEKCVDCGRKFKKSSLGGQKYCRKCANARQKKTATRAVKNKK